MEINFFFLTFNGSNGLAGWVFAHDAKKVSQKKKIESVPQMEWSEFNQKCVTMNFIWNGDTFADVCLFSTASNERTNEKKIYHSNSNTQLAGIYSNIWENIYSKL